MIKSVIKNLLLGSEEFSRFLNLNHFTRIQLHNEQGAVKKGMEFFALEETKEAFAQFSPSKTPH